MRGGIGQEVEVDSIAIDGRYCRLTAIPTFLRFRRSLLWINKKAWQCTVIAIGARLLLSDSALANEASMPIWDLAADWQGDLLNWWHRVSSDFGDLFGQGYGHAPALLLGLSLVVIVPLFVAAGLILRRSGGVIEPDRTVRYPAAQKLPTTNPPPYSHRVIVPGDAFVQIQETSDAELSEFRFNGALMVRIGREDDNDVRLTDPTVHRYHAVISRSADVGYVVSDLSSSDGNGVIVNDERVRRQRLNDGDVITLGTAKLTFRLQ